MCKAGFCYMDKFSKLVKIAANESSNFSESPFRMYNHIHDCEVELLGGAHHLLGRETVLDVIPTLDAQSLSGDFISKVATQFANAFGEVAANTDFVRELMFTILWVVGRVPKIVDFSDVMATCDYVTRIHFGKPVGTFVYDMIFDVNAELAAQSMDWAILKDMVSSYNAVKTHPAVIKFIKILSLAFSGGVFATLGVEARMADIWEMLSESMTKIIAHTDFIAAMIDFAQFVGERIAAFCVTHSWKSLLHTPTEYSRWTDKAFDLLDKSVALANPEAIGLDYHTYTKELCSTINQGEEIKRYVRSGDTRDGVSQVLSRLRVLYNDILIKNACGKMRMAPFSLLLYGGTGVGKSSFLDTLVSHYAKLYGKSLDEGSIYTRTPAEKHWNNFKTSMWCCIIDDVAAINPNAGSEDASLADILLARGNTAFSPPQADIGDKGRTPFMCDLLLATTNTKDLKAHCWFNNPQAIRRRFPYIVIPVPKEAYRKPGSTMLDIGKVPPPMPGTYPDLWDITVEYVSTNEKQETITSVILETDSIYEFISHYNTWIEEHRAGQTNFMAARDTTQSVSLCTLHRLPYIACGCNDEALQIQADDSEILAPQGKIMQNIASAALAGVTGFAAYKATTFTANCASEVLRADPTMIYRPGAFTLYTAQRMATKTTRFCNTQVSRLKIFTRGKIRELLQSGLHCLYAEVSPILRKFVIGLGVMSGLGLTWYFLKREFPEMLGLHEQAAVDEVGVNPTPSNESENVWRKDDYLPSEFLGRLSQSWSNLALSKAASLIARNVVWCQTTYTTVSGKTKHSTFRALCLSGHLYVVPHHVLPSNAYFDMQVIHENNSEGCNGNVRFKMAQNLIYRRPEFELAFFEINHMPGRRNISDALPKKGCRFDAPGRMVIRQPNGGVEYISTKRTVAEPDSLLPQFNMTLDVSTSIVERETASGDCGSPTVVQLPNACIIAGIHVLGGKRLTAVGVPITYEVYGEALQYFRTPVVENEIPFLDGQSFTTNVSQKCTARFIEDGVVQVFGSFDGFKRQPKSTACDTLFTNLLLEDGRKRKFGPAPMKGYMALHHGLKSIVRKQMSFKPDLMRYCSTTFQRRILKHLPERFKEELKSVLPLKTALNGYPGTRFIDSMNFGTSAGYPHNRSKRDFIARLPADEVWQHPIQLSDDMKKEVEHCWDKMSKGISVSPIFMQHLKDEALPMRKVRAGKARIFMGGPFAWSVVVRMVLLPFVRVMQLNKYLFECAPGMNTTSIEWTRLYEYLSKHGVWRMIAGDFEAFDKVMGSLVILEAFRMIREILTACGASEEHILIVQVIAEDVAFAFVNFNGDLMRFFGSNPSGHPLTVIINCLVNSLYMRYCYHELNPEKEVESFPDNVRLVTYGDDNAMGSGVDWFNHTAIAAVLQSVGIGYTMADKMEQSRAFIHMRETTFLKRSFRWEPELCAYAAPLDQESIWKSLMICVPSSEVSPQRQCVDIVESAVAEWFFYGRERFEKEKLYLQDLIRRADLECYVKESTFPTWETLQKRFCEASEDYLKSEPETTIKLVGPCTWVNPLQAA